LPQYQSVLVFKPASLTPGFEASENCTCWMWQMRYYWPSVLDVTDALILTVRLC